MEGETITSLEQLKNLRPSYAQTYGRPEYGLTDRRWQQDFAILKLYVTPYSGNPKKISARYARELFKQNGNEDIEYQGMTSWQSYCRYINDVLKVIKNGETDYCYFKYQILELLKFHYDTLRTKYHDGQGYWSVWLERRNDV